jgi:AraC family transcriptional regulator, glycine betaine-responsive activator
MNWVAQLDLEDLSDNVTFMSNSATTDGPPVTFGFVLTPDYSLMALAAAVEPLRAANLLEGRNLFNCRYFSANGGFLPSSAGGGFQTEVLHSKLVGVDVLFLVAGGSPLLQDDPDLIKTIRTLGRQGIALGGISGGAAILAKAGLMEGRRFTTHWAHVDSLQEISADFLIERDVFVIDRDRYSCAGGVAAMDMMAAVIGSKHGTPLARKISDWFIHPSLRLPEVPQKMSLQDQYSLKHPALVDAVELMSSHLADPLTPEQLAKMTGSSKRQLHRLFSEHCRLPMMTFYRRMRLEKADELLRQSSLSVLEVAISTGFVTTAHFSRCFVETFGVSPKERKKSR